jgi:protein-S-isoprenylcysteine O-methyltransferase Ste14
MSFQATGFEFRHRFWFICGIFCLGFSLYFVDHENVSVGLTSLILGPARNNPLIFDHLVTGFFALGTLIVILGAAIRSWAESYLHSSIVHDTTLHHEKLVADGPFRYVRNPLYLGDVLFALGLGLFASRSGFLIIFFGMLLFMFRLILHEEANLLQLQGDGYRRYISTVPRLIPALRPRIPPAGAKPNWVDGIAGELLLWCGAVAMLVYLVTQKLLYFWTVFGLGFAIYFIQQRIRRRD